VGNRDSCPIRQTGEQVRSAAPVPTLPPPQVLGSTLHSRKVHLNPDYVRCRDSDLKCFDGSLNCDLEEFACGLLLGERPCSPLSEARTDLGAQSIRNGGGARAVLDSAHSAEVEGLPALRGQDRCCRTVVGVV
jgi:hypothetical protein